VEWAIGDEGHEGTHPLDGDALIAGERADRVEPDQRERDSPPPEGGRARGNPRPSISNFWTRGSHPWRRGAQIEPRDQVGGTARRYAGPME
jgi:hypothetical protein